MDRENVIKSIEDCVFYNHECVDCDYDGCVFKHGDCRRDLLADALALLKEQENDIHHMGLIIEEYKKELKEQEEKIEKLNRFVNGFSRDAMPVVRCKD